MRYHAAIPMLAVLLCGAVSAADAQVLQPPERPSRPALGGGPPPDADRVRHELSAQANVQIGYDENLAPPGVAPEIALTRPSGYTGFSDAGLSYMFGSSAKSVEVNARGYANAFRDVDIAPAYGAELNARAHAPLGRRNEFILSQHSSYDPYFQLGAFSALPVDDLGTPAGIDSNPTTALQEARSLGLGANASLTHRFSERARFTGGYSYSSRMYEQGNMFDTRSNAALLNFAAPLGRRTSLNGSSRYSIGRYEQKDGRRRNVDDQNVDLGLSYNKDLSRTRRLRLSAGGGALHVNGEDLSGVSLPYDYWAPSGYAGAGLDFRRSWSVSTDYRRALSVLQGVQPDPFIADTATLQLGGYLTNIVEMVLNAGYATARAGRGSDGAGGRFKSYTGSAQLRFQVARSLSVLVNYNHYQYRLNPIAREALGLPGQTHRNSVRIGLSWSQPIFGRTRRQPQRPPAGRS